MGRFRQWEQRGSKPVREAQDFGSHSVRPRFGLTVATARRLIRLLGGPAGRARRLVTPRFAFSEISVVPGLRSRCAGSQRFLRGFRWRRDRRGRSFPRRRLQDGNSSRALRHRCCWVSWLPRWSVETRITREISLRGEKYQIARANARSAGTLRRCVAAYSGRAESFAAFG